MISRLRHKFIFVLLVVFSISFSVTEIIADEYSSPNFKVLSPVIVPGGYSTSSSFSLIGSFSQVAVGTSSAATYNLFGGFLNFPYVSTPVVSASPGNGQVNLSWNSSDSTGGWVVGGYSVGQASNSGGPYAFTNVGNVLSTSKSQLSNGTRYYFVIRVLDRLDNVIATSTEVSAVPVAPPSPPIGGGGGGGGGGGVVPSAGIGTGSVQFSGRAYPRSTITVLKDAQVVTSTVADASANFSVSLSNLGTGNYFFSVYSEDKNGNRSSLLTFPVSVTSGATSNITGIYIAPTISVDKSQVRKGDNIAIFGQTTTQSEVTIQVNSDEPHFAKTVSDATGIYLYNFDTTTLEYGDHSAKSKSARGPEISSYSSAVAFVVGTTNIAMSAPVKKVSKGDTNNDGRVNLVDFSIVAYWYNRPNPPRNADVNSDGRVNLIDFSIMAYNWTG